MATLVTDLIEPAELVEYARAYDTEVLQNQFTLQRYLPNRNVDDLEWRVRTGTLTDVETAEYRAWDTPAPMTGRPGTSRKRGQLPPVSRMIPLTEEEALRLRALERGNQDPIIQAAYDDVERMIRSVQARVELARGDLLLDGIVTIAENGLALTVDFGMPSAHKVAAPVAWTVANAATAKPITDLLGWIDTYNTTTGELPGRVVMARTRLSALALNAEVRAYSASGGTTPQRVNLATIQDILADQGIPPIEFYDTQVRVGGVATRVIPANKVLLLPAPGGATDLGGTFYGATAESIMLRERNLIEASAAPGIVACIFQNEHPVQTFTLGTAIALPTFANPELAFTATVDA